MTIALTLEQLAWLETYVGRGAFASVEEAARQLIDEQIAARELAEHDDLAWTKPYIDEALADVAAGRIVSREDHLARNAARLTSLKG